MSIKGGSPCVRDLYTGGMIMLISSAIMISIWVLGFATIPLLIFSIINKSSVRAKALIALAVYIPVFVISMAYLSDALAVDLPFSIVIYYMFAVAFALIDLASIIVNCVKMRKLEKGGPVGSTLAPFIVIAVIPVVFMTSVCLRQARCLKKSDLVIQCCSHGNGGIGAYDDFVYGYDGKKFYLLDIGSSYGLGNYLSSDMVRSEDAKTAGHYYVDENSDKLLIYFDDELITEKQFESGYYNVVVESVYYRVDS